MTKRTGFWRTIALGAVFSTAFCQADTAGGDRAPDDDSAYDSVLHYRSQIDAPPARVWPQVMNFGDWMFDYDMIHESGPRAGVGEVLRLYEGQDFFVETIELIPGRLYVGRNHPAVFEGERGTGLVVLILADIGGRTLVDLNLVRRYEFLGEGENPMRAVRQSEAFLERNRETWEERFLPRLKSLSERAAANP
jgi:hypothetical protein